LKAGCSWGTGAATVFWTFSGRLATGELEPDDEDEDDEDDDEDEEEDEDEDERDRFLAFPMKPDLNRKVG